MKYLAVLFVFLLAVVATPAIAQQKILPSERLQLLYDEQQITYTPEKLADVSARCVDSQNKLLFLQRQNNLLVQKRLSVYGDLQKDMRALEHRLARQGADASELDLLIGKQQVALEAMQNTHKNYDSLISDLRNINCAQNPALFLAGIAEIYKQQQKLKEDSSNVYVILQESPKTTFLPLAERLKI